MKYFIEGCLINAQNFKAIAHTKRRRTYETKTKIYKIIDTSDF